jgi:lysophospholipase L1-like esterase
MSLAIKLALGPLLLAQALQTRRSLPRLPEAEGPRQGSVGRGAPGLGLLIVGDSSAAGVGVATQDEALAGRLSRALAQRLGRRVRWQLCALAGVTSAQAIDLLHDARAADVAVVVTGVNDVVDQVSPARALAAREQLLQALQQRAGIRHTVMTPVPPMHRFAGLPQPLRWVAGRDAAVHEQALARWAAQRAAVSHLPFELPMDDPTLLARDGFHPGAPLYRLWGDALAEHIASAVWPRL